MVNFVLCNPTYILDIVRSVQLLSYLVVTLSLSIIFQLRNKCMRIYYIKAKSRLSICLSVCLSVGTFSGTHFAPWFQRGSTPDILDMKRPSLQNTISLFTWF